MSETSTIASNGNMTSTMALFKTGKTIMVDIGIWSGRKKLDPIDIGFKKEDVKESLYTLGSKFLIPKNEIASLERIRADAKSEILRSSQNFPFGQFVPNNKVDPLKTRLNELRDQFFAKIKDIGERYPEMRQKILDDWNNEAVLTAAKTGDPDFVFKIMDNIQSSLKPWSEIEERFSFTIKEYDDINKITDEFIRENTKTMVSKMVEFAEKIKERLSEDNLQERNLKPIQEFLDAIRDSVKIFENENLTKIVDDLDTWTQPGSAEEINDALKGAMSAAMDNIINIASEKIDQISQDSVDGLISYARTLDLSQ